MNAIEKYYKSFGLNKPKNTKELKNEQIYNLYKKPTPEKGDDMPRFQVFKEGEFQQADILYLPEDKGFKYCLVVVDNASRRFDAEPVKILSSKSVLDTIKKIYKRPYVKMPESRLEVDAGKEFQGEFKKYFNDNDVEIRVAKTGRSRQQALVERKNFSIAKLLFFRMTAQELATDEPSTEWVEDLPQVVKLINAKIGKFKPPKIEDLQRLKDKGSKLNHELLEQGTKVRVMLDKPQEVTGQRLSGKFRATDVRWNKDIRIIKHIIMKPGYPPLYLLNDPKGKDSYEKGVAYTKLQLQPVSESENKPPAYLQKKFIVDKILDKKNNKYLIKWKGYPSSQNTWEPVKNIKQDAPEIAKQFENMLKNL